MRVVSAKFYFGSRHLAIHEGGTTESRLDYFNARRAVDAIQHIVGNVAPRRKRLALESCGGWRVELERGFDREVDRRSITKVRRSTD